MRRIMVLNAKGGSGKSTLATNLASYYATRDKTVVLADYDPQSSSLQWLKARSKDRPPIYGFPAWREPLLVPRNTDYLIMDTPAGARGAELTALVRRAQSLVIPVLPSATDIRAATQFVRDLMALGSVVRNHVRLVAVANRVRENTPLTNAMEWVLGGLNPSFATNNTRVYRHLQRFLRRLRTPFITTLRDSVNYQLADERGLGIFELYTSASTLDRQQWAPLIEWLGNKRSIPKGR